MKTATAKAPAKETPKLEAYHLGARKPLMFMYCNLRANLLDVKPQSHNWKEYSYVNQLQFDLVQDVADQYKGNPEDKLYQGYLSQHILQNAPRSLMGMIAEHDFQVKVGMRFYQRAAYGAQIYTVKNVIWTKGLGDKFDKVYAANNAVLSTYSANNPGFPNGVYWMLEVMYDVLPWDTVEEKSVN